VPISTHPIQDVPPLTASTYTPLGSTALLDAIGRTIKETDTRITAGGNAASPLGILFGFTFWLVVWWMYQNKIFVRI